MIKVEELKERSREEIKELDEKKLNERRKIWKNWERNERIGIEIKQWERNERFGREMKDLGD